MFQCGVFPRHWILWSVSWWAGSRPESGGEKRGNKGREPLDPSSWFVCDIRSRSPSSTEYPALCVSGADESLT